MFFSKNVHNNYGFLFVGIIGVPVVVRAAVVTMGVVRLEHFFLGQ